MAVFETDQLGVTPGALGESMHSSDEYAGYVDYFGFEEELKYYLPDGKQWIAFRTLNEGERVKYESKTSRDIKFNRRTDDAAIRVNTAEDRHALLMQSVTNWFMVRRNPGNGNWEPVAFSKGSQHAAFDKWLKVADPRIINDLHQAIVRANPWMTADMTVAMIDEEMKRLEEMRRDLVEREAAEKNS